ncbi:hypothetical protein HDU67_000455, partial [Dinochytrium kinnereticum]
MSQRASFASPPTLNLSVLFTSSPTFPAGAIQSTQPSLDQDLTGEIRELVDIFFNPDLVSFESLILLYLNVMLGSGGGMFCAVFCHDAGQVMVASKVCQNFPNTGLKIVKASGFQ